MSFGEAVTSVFSNYANFSGRARRSEFWYFYLFSLLSGFVFSILILFLGQIASVISFIWWLALLVPTLAVSWRRLHDIGKSGAWFFIGMVPLVGMILLLVWYCTDGEAGKNQYGPDPKT